MTDKVKYTVTIEVEADAIGPAQAIRQALDWARDTESGEGIVTVRASDLSPLRAAVADGRVAQLFTGPVTNPGPICQKPAGVPVAEAREISQRVCEAATQLKDAHNLDAPARGELAARIRAAGDDLHMLTYITPGPICQKAAGVDPDKVRRLAVELDNIADCLDTDRPDIRKRWATKGRQDAYRKAADMVEALTDDC